MLIMQRTKEGMVVETSFRYVEKHEGRLFSKPLPQKGSKSKLMLYLMVGIGCAALAGLFWGLSRW